MAFNIFALPASSIILLLSAAFRGSNALPWAGPEPTRIYKEDAWSPRPTNIPVDPLELFRRDFLDVTVCGWLGGNSADPAVCPTGSSCIHDTAHGYVGCCTTSGPCTAGVYTSCVDKNSPGGNSGPQVINNGVYTCPGDQECYQNTYPGDYRQWGCGSSNQATTVETSFTGQPTDLLLQVVFTGVTFKPMTLSSTSTSSSDSSSSTSESTTSDSSSSRDSSSTSVPSTISSLGPTAASASEGASSTSGAAGDSKSKHKSNVGPIAGGVIGGLAFLIAILAIILFFWRRKQNQKKHPRAGSFISNVRKTTRGTGSTPKPSSGPFQKLQPYSPDDFVSPMAEGQHIQQNPTPPMNPSAFAPPDHSMFSPTEYQGIEERRRENATIPTPAIYYPSPPPVNEEGAPLFSEIENFSSSFHAAIAQMSPPTPPQTQFQSQSRDPESSNVELPPPREAYVPPQYDSAISPTSDARDGGYSAEDKEIGMSSSSRQPVIRKTVPGFRSENVRMEGWQPTELRPAKMTSDEGRGDSTPRYQLVDQPPTEGVPVLYTPGQLRGGNGKHQRQKSSF